MFSQTRTRSPNLLVSGGVIVGCKSRIYGASWVDRIPMVGCVSIGERRTRLPDEVASQARADDLIPPASVDGSLVSRHTKFL